MIVRKQAREPETVEEREIVAKAQAGDEAAFRALYERHYRRTYSVCLRMAKNSAEAEDLAQEAFFQLFRKLATFRGESMFTTWFHRLTVNVIFMEFRKKGRRVTCSLEELMEPDEDGKPGEQFPLFDGRLAAVPDRVSLALALEQLPPGYRLVFIMHDIEGFEHNEIAELLGCSIGNSKSQLHKAHAALVKLLGMNLDPLTILANFNRYLPDEPPALHASAEA